MDAAHPVGPLPFTIVCVTQYCVTMEAMVGLDSQLQELRRGTVVLACLYLLRTPSYGYQLLGELADRGFATDANTLYPLLRRLEKQGWLRSEWNTEDARPRKFYETSAEGLRLAEALSRDWRTLTTAIAALTEQ